VMISKMSVERREMRTITCHGSVPTTMAHLQ
jgi:hypothetical protein